LAVNGLQSICSLLVIFHVFRVLRRLIEHCGNGINMFNLLIAINDLIQLFFGLLNQVGGLIVVVVPVRYSQLLHSVVREHSCREI
jgi:hypothetical protein